MYLFPLETSTDAAATSSGFTPIILMVAMLVIVYFVLIVPQKKREKKDKEMRSNIEVGDLITTIGGIVATVVALSDDTLLIETAADRTKLRVYRWAVQSVEKVKLDD